MLSKSACVKPNLDKSDFGYFCIQEGERSSASCEPMTQNATSWQTNEPRFRASPPRCAGSARRASTSRAVRPRGGPQPTRRYYVYRPLVATVRVAPKPDGGGTLFALWDGSGS